MSMPTGTSPTRLVRLEYFREPIVLLIANSLEPTGMNTIFGGRADEEIHHSTEIAKALDKRERPGAVYGLRLTRNIENLLHDTVEPTSQIDLFSDAQSLTVHEAVGFDTQPLTQTGDVVLFPFLLLEAKSATSAYDHGGIQMQSAFCIRTLLESQIRLKEATGIRSKWGTGLMLWFLANRGEIWYASIAYTENVPEEPGKIGKVEYVRKPDSSDESQHHADIYVANLNCLAWIYLGTRWCPADASHS